VLRGRPSSMGSGGESSVLPHRPAPAAADHVAAVRGSGGVRPDHAVGLAAAHPALVQDEGGASDRGGRLRAHAGHLSRPAGAAGAMTPRRLVVSLVASAEFARAYTLAALTAVLASFIIARLTSHTTLVTILGLLALIG